MNTYQAHREEERAYGLKCTEAGRECLTPREAGKLFGVDPSTIRTAAKEGRVRPVFELSIGRGVPLYRLSDLQAYFAGRSEADPELLDAMRANGVTCFWSEISPGGWLLLCEKPGMRSWDEAAAWSTAARSLGGGGRVDPAKLKTREP